MSWHPGRQRIRGASEQRLSCARVASTSMLAGVSRIFFFYFAQVTNKITGSTDSGARETCRRVESFHAFSFLFTCFHIQTQKGVYTSVSGPLRPPPDVRLPRANCSCSLRQKPASNLRSDREAIRALTNSTEGRQKPGRKTLLPPTLPCSVSLCFSAVSFQSLLFF